MAYREVMCLRLMSLSSWGHSINSREMDIAGVGLPGRPGEGQLYPSCMSVSSACVSESSLGMVGIATAGVGGGSQKSDFEQKYHFPFPHGARYCAKYFLHGREKAIILRPPRPPGILEQEAGGLRFQDQPRIVARSCLKNK